MAMNITEVRLCAVPLENDYKHTLYFESQSAQLSYFQGKVVHSASNLSYQRRENVIRFPKHFDELQNCNYVMYKNTAYTNKWFYGFITDMEYVNDERTDITFEIDVLQTYLTEYTIQPSFVEREHCSSDEVGEHTIEEGLETGEYICGKHSTSEYGGDSMSIVIGVTQNPDKTQVQGMLYNNIYSGVRYYSFSFSDTAGINEFLSQYDADSAGDAITCMFIAPSWLAPLREDHIVAGSNLTYDYYINSKGSVDGVTKNLTTGNVDGYTPRNKKLLSYPFRYLLVSNNNGASAVFKYELFQIREGGGMGNIEITPTDPCFVIEGVLTPGCSVRLVPLYYNGIYRNDECGINMGKFPALNWNSDIYTNWLTQNGVNIALDIVSGVGQIASGVAVTMATAGAGGAVGGGAIASGATQIAGTLAQVYQQSLVPPQSKGNINSGDVITATERNDFHFYDMTVKKEFAMVLDGYFDMFGYKCNLVKVPAKAHRKSYWYTKTIDVSIDGNIPMKYMQKIKDAYNNGITFWRAGATMGNYSLDNAIL